MTVARMSMFSKLLINSNWHLTKEIMWCKYAFKAKQINKLE